MASDAVDYLVDVLFEELGLTTEEAINVLTDTIIEVADGDSDVLLAVGDALADA